MTAPALFFGCITVAVVIILISAARHKWGPK